MDPLYRPEFLILLLKQEGRSLEDHTRQFFLLANATSYPDGALCTFYNTSLNSKCRALSSEDGPREDFAAFVEWTLARNGSPLTVCPIEDLASPTPDPETSQPPSRRTEPEPTAAAESEPSTDREPDLESATDQVCEPATLCIVGVLVEIEGVEESPAHTPATEGELFAVSESHMEQVLDLMDWSTETSQFLVIPAGASQSRSSPSVRAIGARWFAAGLPVSSSALAC
ncbi:uncharacterized protein LOC127966349 [Carassius gibelio]|uniref:uncharacterized protein LOC127966349 n=1 Tax=Carassius gibelio TaxID=101364 RepID=UPI002278ACFA|nr:uncharacterized protein LOC127966349 [Carassius gibelio]